MIREQGHKVGVPEQGMAGQVSGNQHCGDEPHANAIMALHLPTQQHDLKKHHHGHHASHLEEGCPRTNP